MIIDFLNQPETCHSSQPHVWIPSRRIIQIRFASSCQSTPATCSSAQFRIDIIWDKIGWCRWAADWRSRCQDEPKPKEVECEEQTGVRLRPKLSVRLPHGGLTINSDIALVPWGKGGCGQSRCEQTLSPWLWAFTLVWGVEECTQYFYYDNLLFPTFQIMFYLLVTGPEPLCPSPTATPSITLGLPSFIGTSATQLWPGRGSTKAGEEKNTPNYVMSLLLLYKPSSPLRSSSSSCAHHLSDCTTVLSQVAAAAAVRVPSHPRYSPLVGVQCLGCI